MYSFRLCVQVQESVANCLPPLVPAVKADAPELVHKLMDLLLKSDNYGERKGAAYGLAGLVRGLGITALKQLDIMTTLEDAVKDKKNPRRREGEKYTTPGDKTSPALYKDMVVYKTSSKQYKQYTASACSAYIH